MSLQNRVTPEGEIVAVAERGTMFGNRGGCFHRPNQTLLPRQFASRQWICCVLQYKQRRRPLMQPGLYTELFFLDEATAMAAGHRPCFECRRADAVRFAELWQATEGAGGRAAAPHMDNRLQPERLDAQGRKVVFHARFAELPDGSFVRHRGAAALVRAGGLWPWSFEGYGSGFAIAEETLMEVLTPRSIVRVLNAGFEPGVHQSAGGFQ